MTVKNTVMFRISLGPKPPEWTARLTERYVNDLGLEVVDFLENGSEARKAHSYVMLERRDNAAIQASEIAAVPRKNIRKVHGFMSGSSSRSMT